MFYSFREILRNEKQIQYIKTSLLILYIVRFIVLHLCPRKIQSYIFGRFTSSAFVRFKKHYFKTPDGCEKGKQNNFGEQEGVLTGVYN